MNESLQLNRRVFVILRIVNIHNGGSGSRYLRVGLANYEWVSSIKQEESIRDSENSPDT